MRQCIDLTLNQTADGFKMSQNSIRDALGKENDSELDGDEELGTEGELESRRAHPYLRPNDSSPPPAFPSQSLSAVIRAGIRNVFEQVVSPNPLFRCELNFLIYRINTKSRYALQIMRWQKCNERFQLVILCRIKRRGR